MTEPGEIPNEREVIEEIWESLYKYADRQYKDLSPVPESLRRFGKGLRMVLGGLADGIKNGFGSTPDKLLTPHESMIEDEDSNEIKALWSGLYEYAEGQLSELDPMFVPNVDRLTPGERILAGLALLIPSRTKR